MPSKDVRNGLTRTYIGGVIATVYEPKLAMAILERVAEGETLSDICKEPKMPTRSTVHRWINVHPEFQRAFMAARELSAMAFEETALGLAKRLSSDNTFTGTQVRAYEVAMGQLRWSAARRDAARYGQQQNTVVVVPIQINTTLDMGQGGSGQRNTAQFPDIYEIEARVEREQPEGVTMDDVMDVPEVTIPAIFHGDKTVRRGGRPKPKRSSHGKLILTPPGDGKVAS